MDVVLEIFSQSSRLQTKIQNLQANSYLIKKMF